MTLASGGVSGGVHVRRAGAEDLPRLVALDGTEGGAGWSASSFTDELRNAVAQIFVAEAQGTLVGLLVAWFLPPDVQLQNLTVDPAFRRRGVGGVLLDALEQAARAAGATVIDLEVRASNVAARALYRRRGFAEVGRRARYYRDPDEDAVLLRRVLAPAG